MGLVLATTAGLVVWLVLWSLGQKAIDGFIVATLFIVVGATVRMLTSYLPGNRA